MSDDDWREERELPSEAARAAGGAPKLRTAEAGPSLQARMKESARPFLLGLILAVVGTGGLYSYERRASLGYQTLDDALRTVTHLTQVDTIDPTAEGKLVHATGLATTDEEVKDDVFGVHAKVLKLVRVVEVFQWEELRGETEGTVTYIKRFASQPIDAGKFREPVGHDNTRLFPYEGRMISAKAARMGALPCPPSLLSKLSKFEALPITQEMLDAAPLDVKSKAKVSPGGMSVFLGGKPEAPEVGDVRVTFYVVKPEIVSVVAKQEAAKFTPFVPNTAAAQSAGPSASVFEAVDGDEQPKNMLRTGGDPKTAWYTRLAFVLAALIGSILFIKPFRPFAKKLRAEANEKRAFVGRLVGGGMTGVLLATLGAALPWLEYRPLIGGAIVAVGLLLTALIATPVLKKRA
ncbi:MAG: TMEM43 family protein [Polyangiaceae bacterium]